MREHRTFMHCLCRYLALVLSVVNLAACAVSGTTAGRPLPRPEILNPASSADALLAYFDALRKLPSAELAKATEQARKRYASEKSDARLMQYALALAVPGADARHAQQLLEPLARGNTGHDRELRALAVLVYVDLTERLRLEASLQTQMKRTEELEKQLDALKTIERNMLQRETPVREKP